MSAEHSAAPSSLETLARRVAGGPHIAGAVYGTIIAMAVMGAWLADPSSGALETLLSVCATLVVFWVAHVYAHIVGHGLSGPDSVAQQVKQAMRHDWPIVQAGLVPAVVLGLGALGLDGLHERLTMKAAIATSGLLLLTISVAMSRASGRGWGQSLVLAAVLGVLGVLVAVLEVMLG